jgi:hypothetical protein
MENEWGKAFNTEINWGTSPQTAKPWGNVVLSSPSGVTNITGKDENQILIELPYLFLESDTGYMSFRLNPEYTPSLMRYTIYYNNSFYADGTLYEDGTAWMFEYPDRGEYYVDLEIIIDGNIYPFTSNTLTV